MKELFDDVAGQSAKLVTRKYSTSFSLAVRLLAPSIRQAIYNIYGFVRVADEIVDSFQGFPQEDLLDRFEEEYECALKFGISSNPIIHAFQQTVRDYNIDEELVQAFLKSMRADLTKQIYCSRQEMNDYIYGSADVVGLMCLRVFVKGDQQAYERLKEPAMKLGTAFQKVNFIRDLKQDYDELNRSYFPQVDPSNLSQEGKDRIVAEIRADFKEALQGIRQLPKEARFGVYVAYVYYAKVLNKVDRISSNELKNRRVSVSNGLKTVLLLQAYTYYRLNLI
jgi:15-cis-phytoene synthase